jgi:hypothetical protein
LPADETVAPSFGDEGEHLWSEPIGLGPLSWLPPETPAANPSGGNAGSDTLLDQFTLEVRNAGEDGRHHPPVRR